MTELPIPRPAEAPSRFEPEVNAAHPVTRERLAEEFSTRVERGLTVVLEGGDTFFYANGTFVIEVLSPDAPAAIRYKRFSIRDTVSADFGMNDGSYSLKPENPHLTDGYMDPTELAPELFCYLTERYGFELSETA